MRSSAARLDTRTVAALVTTLFFWGSAFPFLRLSLRSYSPAHLTLLRFLTAAAAMVAIALLFRMRMPERRLWPAIAGLSLLNVIAYHVLLNYGLVTVPAGPGSLIVNTAPVFAYIAAGILLGERVDARGWAGLGVCLWGAAIVALSGGDVLRVNAGVLMLVGCAFAWGLSSVLVKPLLRQASAMQIAALSLWFGTAGLLVFSPGLVTAVRHAPAAATWSVVYLGVFPIAVCYATWNYVLSRMPATHAVNYTYLIPLIAVAEAYVLLGERPRPASLVGGAIALGGVIVANVGRRQESQ